MQGIKSPDVEDSSQNSKPHYSLEILENENLQKLFPTGSKVKIYSRNGANGSPEKGRPFIHYNQKLLAVLLQFFTGIIFLIPAWIIYYWQQWIFNIEKFSKKSC